MHLCSSQCTFVLFLFHFLYIVCNCLVGWSCRIHWLHLYRGVRPPQTILMDMNQNNLMVRFQWCRSLREAEYPFIAIAPRSFQGPIYGLNRTKLRTNAKRNSLKYKCLTTLKSLKYNCLTTLKSLKYNCLSTLKSLKYKCLSTLKSLKYKCLTTLKSLKYKCLTTLKSLKYKSFWKLDCVLIFKRLLMLNWIV